MKKFLFLMMVLVSFKAQAYDVFHPEADANLKSGQPWQVVVFDNNSASRVYFRSWYPYPADAVWKVLTDTNRWKDVISDYADSRTLNKEQFDLANEKKPDSAKALLDLIGSQTFASNNDRVAGKVWTSYVYQRFKLPWPLSDRWMIMRVKNDETNADKGSYSYDYKMTLGNFKDLKGHWELLPIPDKPGWTEFRGEYTSDAGISIPHFLAKSIYKSSQQKTTQAHLKELARTGAKKANP